MALFQGAFWGFLKVLCEPAAKGRSEGGHLVKAP